MARGGEQHVGEASEDVRPYRLAFVPGRHVVDSVGRDAEVVRPEPHQPFDKADVSLEPGVEPRLDLLEEVLSLAIGRALRGERRVRGLGGVCLAGRLGPAWAFALAGDTLFLLVSPLREDRLRPPLGTRLEGGARRRGGADELRIIDAA